MRRYLIALPGAAVATFLAVGIALAGDPLSDAVSTTIVEQPVVNSTGDAEGGDVEQEAEQTASTDQDADADANAIQVGGANLAVSILSHGDTYQSNRNENEAEASNKATVIQVSDQDQWAHGGDVTSSSRDGCPARCEPPKRDGKDGYQAKHAHQPKPDCSARCASGGDAQGGDVEQEAEQTADVHQTADADARAVQVGGANLAVSILSHGDTYQSNRNENEAEASNRATVFQVSDQDQWAHGGDATSGDALTRRCSSCTGLVA